MSFEKIQRNENITSEQAEVLAEREKKREKLHNGQSVKLKTFINKEWQNVFTDTINNMVGDDAQEGHVNLPEYLDLKKLESSDNKSDYLVEVKKTLKGKIPKNIVNRVFGELERYEANSGLLPPEELEKAA